MGGGGSRLWNSEGMGGGGGAKAFWNFRRQGRVKTWKPSMVGYGYFLELPNRKQSCTPSFYGVIQTLVKVWENSKKLWKHSPAARVPTAFLVLPNFHSCLYNLIETQYMFSIS